MIIRELDDLLSRVAGICEKSNCNIATALERIRNDNTFEDQAKAFAVLLLESIKTQATASFYTVLVEQCGLDSAVARLIKIGCLRTGAKLSLPFGIAVDLLKNEKDSKYRQVDILGILVGLEGNYYDCTRSLLFSAYSSPYERGLFGFLAGAELRNNSPLEFMRCLSKYPPENSKESMNA